MYDKCRRYAVDWNIILQNTDIDSLEPNESWPLQHCDKGWEYNKTDVQSSIVIDVRKIREEEKEIVEEIFYFLLERTISFSQCIYLSQVRNKKIMKEKKSVEGKV